MRRIRQTGISIFIFASLLASVGASAGPLPQADEGAVRFYKIANSAFDPFIESPNAAEQQWMRSHYFRMQGWSPHFDTRLAWFPNGWAYKDAYAIIPDWPVYGAHPEWVLRDAAGNQLYIPFACSGGTCPQFAADFGNPDFRANWIAEAIELANTGYVGIWVDDVNMTWRVSNGSGDHVTPIDPRTGNPMTLTDWRRYMAEFMEEIRAALPDMEIGHNIVWYAGNQLQNTNPLIHRQIDAADLINLERGVTDQGLVGGNNQWGIETFLSFVDFIHGRGRSVILMDEGGTTTQRQYALAGWLMISSGTDLMATEYHGWSSPDTWWQGYDLDLGVATGPRYQWQNLLRRDFECGIVLMNQPNRSTVNVQLPGTYQQIDGPSVSSVSLAAKQSAILLTGCASFGADADNDGIADVADNCIAHANPDQRDTDLDQYGNLCDADLNNDCIVNNSDLGLMRLRFFTGDADADFDGDGTVGPSDLGLLRVRFFEPPGPSAGATCN